MADSTGNPIHCACGGTGQYVVKNEDGFIGSIATHLCPCRLSEPLRTGEAQWWTTDEGETLEFESATKQQHVSAHIAMERPVSADNHRLFRTVENMYWPTLANLDGDISGYWTSAMLRDFADWLRKAADECDKLDEPESCGLTVEVVS